jgi:AcrR family transcriptional regulator
VAPRWRSTFHLRVIRQLGAADPIELFELPSNLLTQVLGPLVGIVLQLDFEEKIGYAHRRSTSNFYTMGMPCAICQIRRPRRYCPGVNGDICSICCGTEREVTVACPLDCPYLQEARKHDRPVPREEEQLPNREIRITEEFLEEHEELLTAAARILANVGLGTRGVTDLDVREALAALIRTYRTLESGLYYDSLPENVLAATIFRYFQDAITAYRRAETEDMGVPHTRDSDVLAILVFLQRLELDRNNGRPRSRAFLDFLREIYPALPGSPPAGSTLLAG